VFLKGLDSPAGVIPNVWISGGTLTILGEIRERGSGPNFAGTSLGRSLRSLEWHTLFKGRVAIGVVTVWL